MIPIAVQGLSLCTPLHISPKKALVNNVKVTKVAVHASVSIPNILSPKKITKSCNNRGVP